MARFHQRWTGCLGVSRPKADQPLAETPLKVHNDEFSLYKDQIIPI